MHEKMISCINVVPDPADPSVEVVISGGADKMINLYRYANSTLQLVHKFAVEATPRAVDFMNGTILAGLANCTILELKNSFSGPQAAQKVVQMRAHYEGEAWGLALYQGGPDECLYFTSGDDN